MKKAFLLVSGTVLLAAACSSPTVQAGRHQEEWHPATEMLDKYADKTGTVTRRAMEAGLRTDFDKADANHNGCLSEDEVRAINAERWKEDASAASPLIDFKRTGCVDFEEFAATPRSLFDQLDRKGEGVLTRAELHPGQKRPGLDDKQTQASGSS